MDPVKNDNQLPGRAEPTDELLTPNAETVAAMREARAGNLESVDSIEALMAALNAEE